MQVPAVDLDQRERDTPTYHAQMFVMLVQRKNSNGAGVRMKRRERKEVP